MFRIQKKYYKKIATQLLTHMWHVILLQHNNPLKGENVTIDSGGKLKRDWNYSSATNRFMW